MGPFSEKKLFNEKILRLVFFRDGVTFQSLFSAQLGPLLAQLGRIREPVNARREK